MKDRIILILVIVAVAITTLFYRSKINEEPDTIDKLEIAYSVVKNITGENGNLSYLYLDDTTNFFYSYLWTRYVLAPRHLSPNAADYDTLITICPVKFFDSTVASIIYKRKILWKQQFGYYFFFLSCDKLNAKKQ